MSDIISPIDQYIAERPAEQRAALNRVHAAIKQAIPDAEEKISWQMPTYRKGRNLCHFAAHNNHVGIYPGVEAIEHFAERLTAYKSSKGAFQLPYKTLGDDEIRLVADVAAWCYTNNVGH